MIEFEPISFDNAWNENLSPTNDLSKNLKPTHMIQGFY